MSKIITPDSPKAPAFIKGVQALDPGSLLKNATPEQIKALTHAEFGFWAQFSGLDVDGRPFEFDSHRYLLPIYFDNGKHIVWMKAAQLGATVYMLLRLLWFCRYHQVNAGMYFPTEQGVKCAVKGTKILTKNRGIINIEDVFIGEEVWSGWDWRKVTDWIHAGVKAGTEVVLNNGASLITSNVHRVWAWRKNQYPTWIKTCELTTDDLVLYDLSSKFTESAVNKEEYDIGYACGILQGDGGLSLMDRYPGLVSFSNGDSQIIDFWKSFCIKYAGKEPRHPSKYDWSIRSTKLRDILKAWGLKSCYSWEKEVPSVCWKSKSYMVGFISGLFDTDGTINKGKNNRIEFNLTAGNMLREVQIMLAALGVDSRFKEGTKLLANHKHIVHKLHVNSSQYEKMLGVGIKLGLHKANVPAASNAITNQQLEVFSREHLSSLLTRLPSWGGHRLCAGVPKPHMDGEKLHFNTVLKLLDWSREGNLLTNDEIAFWSKLVTQRWVSVKEIKARESVDFYDLTVQEDHSYWSNGIVSHNSLSKARLGPIIDSNAEMHANMTHDGDTLGLKQIQNVHGKLSSLYMLYLGGKASKDSVPLDVIGFDEVRLVKDTDIDQAIERISHSSYKYRMFLSTAGFPGCFAGDTKVVVREKATNKILAKEISSLVGNYEDYQALSYNRVGGNRLRWRDITGAVCRGVRKMVNVNLWGGQTIRCTPDHRFGVLDKAEHGPTTNESIFWTPISEVARFPNRFGGLAGPDGVLCVNKIPEYENSRWGERTYVAPFDSLLCKMIGIFIAEGTLHNKEIQIWQNPDKPIRQICVQWAQLNDLPYRETDDGVFIKAKHRPDLISLFSECGHLAENKKIPQVFLEGSAKQLEHVLEGIILGDGHIRKERTNTHESYREFDIYTGSRKLSSQLQFLGLKIGKPLSLCVRSPRAANHLVQYQLSYNPNSFRNKEIINQLGQVAVGELEESSNELAYDIEIEENSWFVLAESGCLVHNSDIHKRFTAGTQLTWHIKCNCLDGFVPSDCFPDCIMDTGKEVFLYCPRCKFVVSDPQNGNFIAHNPGANYNSYHVSQLCSRHISPAEVWEEYRRTTNIKEFFNAKLGRPFIDEKNQPITPEVLESSVNTNLTWAYAPGAQKHRKQFCAMGIDQGDGTAHVTIAKRGPDGRKEIVHVEMIERGNPRYWENGRPVTPFKRIYELMREFDVRLCVCDAQPNHNEAMQFAHDFPAKVYLGWYGEAGQDMVKWTDKLKMKEQIRKGSKEIKLKWQCIMNRYMSMDYALRQWVDGAVQIPHPDALTQITRNAETGRYENCNIMRTVYWKHLRSLVREQQILDDETGRSRMIWRYTQGDPHFAHSWNYCNIALERMKRMPIFTMV